MQRLLLIKTSSLGDIVHAFPAVSDLARHDPNLAIDWMVEESLADLPRLHPAINRVIPVALRRWRKSWWSGPHRAERRLLRQVLQALKHEASLDLQGLFKSALMARYGPPQRFGYDWASIREPLASLCYSQRFKVGTQQHAVERNRQLTAAAMGYPMKGGPVDYGLTTTQPYPSALPQPYIVCLHGTSRSNKEWPASHWIALGNQLSQEGFTLLFPAGNDAERQRAHQLADAIANAHALQPLTLEQLAAMLAHAHAVIGVDTGLTHLATALRRPVVALYTATDPAATGVYGSELAINLGGLGQCPTPADVLTTLDHLTS